MPLRKRLEADPAHQTTQILEATLATAPRDDTEVLATTALVVGDALMPEVVGFDDADLAIRGKRIQRLQAESVIAAYRVGKELLDIKNNTPKGKFLEFLDKYWRPWDPRTAQRRMALARMVGQRESLLLSLGNVDTNKVQAIFELPEDDLRELEETGEFGEVKLAELPTTSYTELKKQIERATKKLADVDHVNLQLQKQRDDLQEKLNRANERLVEQTDPRNQREAALLAKLVESREALKKALLPFERVLAECGTRIEDEEVSAEFRAEAVASAKFAEHLVKHALLKFELMLGGADEFGNAYRELLYQNGALAAVSPDLAIPPMAVLPVRDFDDEPAAPTRRRSR